MKIETAVIVLFEKYHEALMSNVKAEKTVIFDPVAWALYQTWKIADERRKE